MRHNWINFTEHLNKGLRIYPDSGRREGWAKDCYNFTIGVGGIEPYVAVLPLFAEVTKDWPFPQVFWNSKMNVLAEKDRFHTFQDDFVLSNTTMTSAGGSWELLDYQDFIFLTNGVKMYYWDVDENEFAEKVADEDFPLFSSCDNFRGQAFIANIKSNWRGMDEASVAWSKIGEFDFRPGMRNEANFTRASFGGEIFKIRSLGDGLIAYGNRGILGLIPLPNSPHVGQKVLPSNGIISENAIAGDEHLHIFIDNEGYLWKLGRDMLPKRIGYQEYMQRLDLDQVVISYDKLFKIFYISDGAKCYQLTAYGMSEVFQSCGSVDAGRGIIFQENAVAARVVSSRSDFGMPGEKLISGVIVETPYVGPMTFIAQNNHGLEVKAAGSPQGFGCPKLSGSKLAVGVEFPDYALGSITTMKFSLTHMGKEAVRGQTNV